MSLGFTSPKSGFESPSVTQFLPNIGKSLALPKHNPRDPSLRDELPSRGACFSSLSFYIDYNGGASLLWSADDP